MLIYSRDNPARSSQRQRRLLAAPDSPDLFGCRIPLRMVDVGLFFSFLRQIGWAESLPAMGNITLFVPLDSALAKLGHASLSISASPAMKAMFLRAFGAHVVPAALRASDLVNRTVVDTMGGGRLQLRQLPGGKKQLWAADGRSHASIVSVDVEFCRGWIHIVDGTLFDVALFSEVSTSCDEASVLTKAKAAPQLTTFLDLVARAGIAADVADSSEPLTIFAPVDSGTWQGLNLSDGTAIVRLLQEHIVHGIYSQADLMNNATMFTLASTFLNSYADAEGQLILTGAEGHGSRVLAAAPKESCSQALFQLSQPLTAPLRTALPVAHPNVTASLPSATANPNQMKLPVAQPLMTTMVPAAQLSTTVNIPVPTRLPSRPLPTQLPSNFPTPRPVSLAPACVPLETLLSNHPSIGSFASALRAWLASAARMPSRPFTILAPQNDAFSRSLRDRPNVRAIALRPPRSRLGCAAVSR